MTKKNGFSLIELLVVASIIAVLLVGGVVSYRNSTAKARDSKRLGDMQQIRSSLEMYRADYGAYPATANINTTLETNSYIDKWPTGPQSDVYVYEMTGSGAGYELEAYVEDTTGLTNTCTVSKLCMGSTACSYCLKNP